jgi:2-polyprenyl-3-methyl-5-hydroxy-6-metoxy-1,4-benzoquinol methylase
VSDQSRGCFICGDAGSVAYAEKITTDLINEFTFASRKEPELMHYEYRRCDECQLLFTSYIPERAALLKAYEDAAFDAEVESAFAARAYVRALREILGSQTNSVLDVGCGDATFLAECRSLGVTNVQGIEPSPAASALAPAEFQAEIFNGGYEEFITDEKFDLVTLFQTVEHIDDPESFMVRAKNLIRPGGFLAIACHDYRAPVNRILKESSPIFDIEHLQIFSQRSISRALEKAGYVEVKARAYSNTYPVNYFARLAPIPKSVKHSRIMRKGRLGRIPLRIPLGNIMAIGRVPF